MPGPNADLTRDAASREPGRAMPALWNFAFAGILVAAFWALPGEERGAVEPRDDRALAASGRLGDAILSLSWSPDGRSLAMAGFVDSVQVWEMGSGRPWSLDDGPRSGQSSTAKREAVAYSPDGRSLAVGDSGGMIAIWDLASRARVATVEAGADPVTALSFSPDGRSLAWSSGWAIRVRDVAGGPVRVLPHSGRPHARLAYSPDGRTIAAGGADGLLRLWDVESGEERFARHWNVCGVGGVAFTGDGRAVVACGISGPMRKWDVATGTECRAPVDESHTSAIAFSPDGGRLASASRDGTIRVSDAASGRELGRFGGHPDMVAVLAWSPDGRILASGGYDGATRLWDVSGVHRSPSSPMSGPWLPSVAPRQMSPGPAERR